MLFETVRRARNRILGNEGMRYAAYALSAALASLILLLLAGTQILSWQWLFLLPTLTLSLGAYATWRKTPSLYQVAQRVDANLKLADTLSTALFFDGKDHSQEMCRPQRLQAEKITAGVDLRRAIPMRVPRELYVSALLALTAGSLFGLRYGLDRRLDLRAPLARIVQERLGYSVAKTAARDPQKPAQRDPKHPDEPGFSLEDSQQKGSGELDAAPDNALDNVGVPDVENKTASRRPDPSKLAQSTPLEGDRSNEDQPESASINPGNQQQQTGDGKKGPGAGKQGQGDDKQGSGNSENAGLLGKFRDAMSSLMNRMRQQSGANGAQQQQSAQNGQPKSQSGNAAQNGKQGQQPGDGQKDGAKDGQPGDDSQNAQNAQAGNPGESGQQPATKQPGSGIGRQDGNKDVKLAEQLAAMGKISEIIGKRSANVSGEVTVEVQSSNQQLKTPYAQRTAQHAEAGGEINRDEIPAALQAYVQQYFEEIRKQAARTGAPHAKKQPDSPKPGL